MSSSPQDGQYPPPPYPPVAVTPASVLRSARPAAMRRAVSLMYAGAAVGAVGDIAGSLATDHSAFYFSAYYLRPGAEQAGGLASGVFGAVFGAGLWLWMAWKNGAGRSWARVLSCVFFGFQCLGLIAAFAVLFLASNEAVSFAGTLAEWGIGLAALILLWQPGSSQFFAFAEQLRLGARYGNVPPGYPPASGYPAPGPPPRYGQPGSGEPPR